MAVVKTAISIDRKLYDAGEQLAHELNVSRSDLYGRALQALLQERQRQEIMDRINEVQASLTDEERADERVVVDGLQHAFEDTLRLTAERGESW
jgi:metal-responsive CopG/Arc/MetJ family transcriptional regulator